MNKQTHVGALNDTWQGSIGNLFTNCRRNLMKVFPLPVFHPNKWKVTHALQGYTHWCHRAHHDISTVYQKHLSSLPWNTYLTPSEIWQMKGNWAAVKTLDQLIPLCGKLLRDRKALLNFLHLVPFLFFSPLRNARYNHSGFASPALILFPPHSCSFLWIHTAMGFPLVGASPKDQP